MRGGMEATEVPMQSKQAVLKELFVSHFLNQNTQIKVKQGSQVRAVVMKYSSKFSQQFFLGDSLPNLKKKAITILEQCYTDAPHLTITLCPDKPLID